MEKIVDAIIYLIILSPPSIFLFFMIFYFIEKGKEDKIRIKKIDDFIPQNGCRRGLIVGYKKLVRIGWNKFVSPQHNDFVWRVGEWVYSDKIPTPDNTNGIYITKDGRENILNSYDGELVKIEANGWYVEHEHGYRVNKARIIAIIE